jgi:hypothetical protein
VPPWRRAGQSQAPLSCAAPGRHASRVALARTLGRKVVRVRRSTDVRSLFCSVGACTRASSPAKPQRRRDRFASEAAANTPHLATAAGCPSFGGQLAVRCLSPVLGALRQGSLPAASSTPPRAPSRSLRAQCPARPCSGAGAPPQQCSRQPVPCGARSHTVSASVGLARLVASRQHCGLTPRSRGDPTRQATLGRQPAVAGSIVGCRPRASCLAGRLSSNVRQRHETPCSAPAGSAPSA